MPGDIHPIDDPAPSSQALDTIVQDERIAEAKSALIRALDYVEDISLHISGKPAARGAEHSPVIYLDACDM